MRRITVIMWGILVVVAATARPATFPPEVTYRIYVSGELAGKNVIKITEKGDALVFEGHTTMDWDEFQLDLRCRTEVAADDLELRSFSYEGRRGGTNVSGTVWVDGDSITGDLVFGDEHYPSSKNLSGLKVFFENYMVEHQVLLLNMVAASEELYQRVSVFFPIDFIASPCLALVESEVEVATTPPSVCRKYHFTIQQGSAFYGYFDPKRKLPVYMDFPASNTEIFLEGAFDDSPLTKYTRPEASQ